ncbi:hypothetical protein N1I87_02200 [Bacillus sp. FSL W8-0102]|uniref:hypothetical protein n=1 Tax=Bacillus sp. FSL W8-0102 TaxID=2978205 RepID=UPI0030FB3D5E
MKIPSYHPIPEKGIYCPFMRDKVKLPSVAHGWLVELIGHIGAVIPDRDSISSSKLEILGMYCPFMRDKVKLPSVVHGWLVEPIGHIGAVVPNRDFILPFNLGEGDLLPLHAG